MSSPRSVPRSHISTLLNFLGPKSQSYSPINHHPTSNHHTTNQHPSSITRLILRLMRIFLRIPYIRAPRISTSKPFTASPCFAQDLRLEHLQAMAQRLGFSDLKEGELKRLYAARKSHGGAGNYWELRAFPV